MRIACASLVAVAATVWAQGPVEYAYLDIYSGQGGNRFHPTTREECRSVLRDSRGAVYTIGVQSNATDRLNSTRQFVSLGRWQGDHWTSIAKVNDRDGCVYSPAAVADSAGGIWIAWSEFNELEQNIRRVRTPLGRDQPGTSVSREHVERARHEAVDRAAAGRNALGRLGDGPQGLSADRGRRTEERILGYARRNSGDGLQLPPSHRHRRRRQGLARLRPLGGRRLRRVRPHHDGGRLVGGNRVLRVAQGRAAPDDPLRA